MKDGGGAQTPSERIAKLASRIGKPRKPPTWTRRYHDPEESAESRAWRRRRGESIGFAREKLWLEIATLNYPGVLLPKEIAKLLGCRLDEVWRVLRMPVRELRRIAREHGDAILAQAFDPELGRYIDLLRRDRKG